MSTLESADFHRVSKILQSLGAWDNSDERTDFVDLYLRDVQGDRRQRLMGKLDLTGAPERATRALLIGLERAGKYEAGKTYLEAFLAAVAKEVLDFEEEAYLQRLAQPSVPTSPPSPSASGVRRTYDPRPTEFFLELGRRATMSQVQTTLRRTMTDRANRIGVIVFRGDSRLDQTRQFADRLRETLPKGPDVFENWETPLELTDCNDLSDGAEERQRVEWCLGEFLYHINQGVQGEALPERPLTEFAHFLALFPYRVYLLIHTIDGHRPKTGMESWMRAYLTYWRDLPRLTNRHGQSIQILVVLRIDDNPRHRSALGNQVEQAVAQVTGQSIQPDGPPVTLESGDLTVTMVMQPRLEEIGMADLREWSARVERFVERRNVEGRLPAEAVLPLQQWVQEQADRVCPGKETKPISAVLPELDRIYGELLSKVNGYGEQ